jgi:hypothetical protein
LFPETHTGEYEIKRSSAISLMSEERSAATRLPQRKVCPSLATIFFACISREGQQRPVARWLSQDQHPEKVLIPRCHLREKSAE